MRRNVFWAVLVAATALIQTTWLGAVRIQGALPDLTLLLVIYFALRDGEERAMWTGVLGGLFQDVAGNAVIGHNILCNVVIGYIVARVCQRLITDHHAVRVALVILACLARGVLYTLAFYVQNPDLAAVHHIVVTVVPGAFYTAICALFLFPVLDRPFVREAFVKGEALEG